MGAIAGCTCCGTCEIGSDTFPTDGAGVPSGWTARTGAADVVGTALEITTSNSIILFNTGHPDNIASCIVDVEIVSWGGNDPARVIVGHDGADDDDFYYCEAKLYELKLCKMTAGVPSVLKCVAHDATSGTLRVYFDGATSGVFAATLGSKSVWTTGVSSTGKYVALGLGTVDGGVTFDNFVLTKYKQSDNSCVQFTPAECAIAGDDFERPDDSDPGCPWTELAGTSAIDTGKFSFTAANSRALFTPSTPDGEMSVTVSVTGSANDNVAEIGVGSNSGATSLFYARLTTGTNKTLILGSLAGGTLATHSDIDTTAGSTYTITVTLASGRLCAHLTDNTQGRYLSVAVTVPSTESYATLGCRTVSGSVKFDNFILQHGFELTGSPTCPACGITGNVCGDCCPEAYTTATVSIVGGFTDNGACTLCGRLGGDYICDLVSTCVYLYEECPIGSPCEEECDLDEGYIAACSSSGDPVEVITGIKITTTVALDADGNCYVIVTISLQSVNNSTVDPVAVASYRSPVGAAVAPCDGVPLVLDLINIDACDNRVGGCVGTWPSTITVLFSA